jgi:outer membrane protein assembly factor BamB
MYAFTDPQKDSTEGSTDYKMFKYDLANTNSPETEAPDNVVESWKFDIEGVFLGSPAVVDGKVYFGSDAGVFYCINAESGEEVWSLDVGKAIIHSPAVVGGRVYFTSGTSTAQDASWSDNIKEKQPGTVYALSSENGEKIWEFKLDEGSHSPPTVARGLVYFGAHDNSFYAVDAYSGEQVWRFDEADDIFCGNKAGIKDGSVYAGSHDGSMYALSAETGELLWEFETEDKVVSCAVITGESVYFGSHDNNLYAVDIDSGKEMWSYRTNGEISSSPAYKDGTLYLGSGDGNLYAISSKKGEIIWRYNTEGRVLSTPLVTQNRVYFGSGDRSIYALENKFVDEGEYVEYMQEQKPRTTKDEPETEEEILNQYYSNTEIIGG